MSEAVLNALAQRLVEMTLSKTRYDLWDLEKNEYALFTGI